LWGSIAIAFVALLRLLPLELFPFRYPIHPLVAPFPEAFVVGYFLSDEFGVSRAFVRLTSNSTEDAIANAMDSAIFGLANQLAGNNPSDLQVTSQSRDGLGTTYHEAGTLWMGTNPQASVTDTNGRFHHIANAFCADQALFVTVGSVNPTSTGLVLSRKVAQAAVAQAIGAPPPV